MAVRRAGVQGAATPDGVLTRSEKTTVGRVVKEMKLDLSLQLLNSASYSYQ